MGFPSTPDTKIRSRNDAAAVAALLREAHGGGHVCVWNLAEEAYDYSLFDNQVGGGVGSTVGGTAEQFARGRRGWVKEQLRALSTLGGAC